MPNLRKWSTTATGNASIAGGATTINWAEGQPSAAVNNSMREETAQIRQVYKPSEWGWVEHSSTASVASQTTFKIAANVTADYVQGRRVRLTGGSTVMYGDIVSASFTAETTITLRKDSGSLSASMSIAALSVVYNKTFSGEIKVPKLANETVNNSAVLQDDDELFFPVAASTDYEFEFDFFFSSGATPDFQFQVTGPAAPTIIYIATRVIRPDVTDYFNIQTTFSVTDFINYASGTVGHVKITGLLHNGVNAGTVRLQWAQFNATATNTIVRKGGTVRYSTIP